MIWLLAVAALLAGLLWVVKGGAILLGYGQPEHLFELALLLFAFVTLGLARWVRPGRVRRVGVALAVTAVIGCLIAVLSSLIADDVVGPDMVVGVVALSAALIVVGRALHRVGAVVGGLAFAVGVGMIPAILFGGALSVIDERLLEVPVIAVALAWIAVGITLLRLRTASREAIRFDAMAGNKSDATARP